jgi:hypothetical protein
MTINEAFKQVQAGFIEWDGFFKDPNYTKSKLGVSWHGASSLVLPDEVTIADLQMLAGRRQYSFRVSEDDSIFQIGYEFHKNGKLSAARLAYYQIPGGEVLDLSQEFSVEPAGESGSELSVTWLRLDFTDNAAIRVGHTPCHLHLAGFREVRFSVFGVPSPSQFLEFVVSHFYPADYASRRLSQTGLFETYDRIDAINTTGTQFGREPRDLLRRLPHVLFPER